MSKKFDPTTTTTGDFYDEERELIFIQADLSTAAGCTKVVNEVTSRFGGIDILVSVVGASSAPSGGFVALMSIVSSKSGGG